MDTPPSSRLQQVVRAALALLAGALMPALFAAALYMRSLGQEGSGTQPSFSWFGAVFIVVLAFSLAHVVVLGLPLLLLGPRLRALRWWSVLLAAFVIGFVPYAWAAWPDVQSALLTGGLGVVGGLSFWLVWRYWRQPAAPAT